MISYIFISDPGPEVEQSTNQDQASILDSSHEGDVNMTLPDSTTDLNLWLPNIFILDLSLTEIPVTNNE